MPAPEGERIAKLEQRQDDADDRMDALDKRLSDDHHRLRGVEGAIDKMLEAQKLARRAEERQYERLGLRIQWASLAVTVGMFVLAGVELYVHMGHG